MHALKSSVFLSILLALTRPSLAAHPVGYPDSMFVAITGAANSDGSYPLPWNDMFHDYGVGLNNAGCVTFTQLSGDQWRFSITDNNNDLYIAGPTVTWSGTGPFPASGLVNFTTIHLTTGQPANAAAYGYGNLVATIPEPTSLMAIFASGALLLKRRTSTR